LMCIKRSLIRIDRLRIDVVRAIQGFSGMPGDDKRA
jgi:hypothetical protein